MWPSQNVGAHRRIRRKCGVDPSVSSKYTNWLLEFINSNAVYAALDVGCGASAITIELRQRLGSRTLIGAIDIDKRAVRRAGCINGVDAARADIARLPYPDGAFDLVVAGHVLYYPEDSMVWLCELRRVMCRGATLLATTNSANSGRRLLDLHVEACQRAGEMAMARRAMDPTARDRFTLENGAPQLRQLFSTVSSRFRDETLTFRSVDSAHDIYLQSLFARGASPGASERELGVLASKLAPHMRTLLMSVADTGGEISVPRRSGCFIARI